MKLRRDRPQAVAQGAPTVTEQRDTLTARTRAEIVRRYWLKGELTPLGVANWLAGQPAPRPA